MLVAVATLLPAMLGCQSGFQERAAESEPVDSAALHRLGEALFFDVRLSDAGSVSCASCHLPDRSFADGLRTSIGQNGASTVRNTPSLINRAGTGLQFWDGRARSLVDQVVHPLENPTEMGSDAKVIARRIGALESYRVLFEAAFGTPQSNPVRLSVAIARFVESLQTYDSDYDRALATGAVAPLVRLGAETFRSVGCDRCHFGRTFSDERFHNSGVAWRDSRDLGRARLTGRREDQRAFKTPTLRELVRTAPYMHDGSMETLSQVIDHYADLPPDPQLDPILRSAALSVRQRDALVAFLSALTDSRSPPFANRRPADP